MKIVLATGIYPPQIGGPATYCRRLADHLVKTGHDVTVVTYGDTVEHEPWTVETVPRSVPLLRWWWYAQKLQEVATDADIVYAFSSVSCGIPLVLSGVKAPKRVLRLGGDFFWERYTDFGGKKSLREWYRSGAMFARMVMGWLLRRFDHIVFSTGFQQDIYEEAYRKLPKHSVIENALAIDQVVPFQHHVPKTPFRMLFLGRFVPFKNLDALIDAVAQLPDCTLTLVGDGPLDQKLRDTVTRLGLDARVRFVSPVSGKEKFEVFGIHDLLVIPSLTDISPNTALEARSVGLPVLLTKHNGLSRSLIAGIAEAQLGTPADIVREITRVRDGYGLVAEAAAQTIAGRPWSEVASETEALFGILQRK